tara:strand:- start:45 stop:443 length:399 start_codon:yes stop_codon:yes gene_type:complete
MPFALIPDGFTLKKVTKAQEQAVKDKRRHDNVQAILKDEKTIPIITSGVLLFVGGALIDRFLEEVDFPTLPDVELQKAKDKAVATVIATTPLTLPATILSKVGPDQLQQQFKDVSEEGLFGAFEKFLKRGED